MNTTTSIKAKRTAALFGIDLDENRADTTHAQPDARELANSITPGRILHITGPSGVGKSTFGRAVTTALQSQGSHIIDAQRINPPNQPNQPNQPCVDCFPGPLNAALTDISSAGLADARCFLRTPDALSDGEHARLKLALALRQANALAPRPVVIVIDEFAATLDRPTARGVARLLRRGVSATTNAAAITITSHDDLDAPLQPDHWLHLGAPTPQSRKPRRDTEPTRRIILEQGDNNDYRALSHWHYRPGHPAAIIHTLRLRHTQLNETIGVLVVAMPTLNNPWRNLAWPRRFSTSCQRANAKRINDEIRRIARVIIDPRFRGLGLAQRLVRAYLDNPITPCTEAAAVMGAFSRFFQSAGMTAYRTPPNARQARLLDALDHMNIQPFDLASPRRSWEQINATPPGAPFIERELRRWAGASRSTARHTNDDADDLWRRACRSIAGVPIGYAHTSAN